MAKKRSYIVVNGKHHRTAGKDAQGNLVTRTYVKGDTIELTDAEAESWGVWNGVEGVVRPA